VFKHLGKLVLLDVFTEASNENTTTLICMLSRCHKMRKTMIVLLRLPSLLVALVGACSFPAGQLWWIGPPVVQGCLGLRWDFASAALAGGEAWPYQLLEIAPSW
jgi:hypothetical protein